MSEPILELPPKNSKRSFYIKLTIIIGLFLFAAVFLVGILIYQFEVKEYDTADVEVEEIVRTSYKIKLPGGTELEFDEKGNLINEKAITQSASSDSSSSNQETPISTDKSSVLGQVISLDGQMQAQGVQNESPSTNSEVESQQSQEDSSENLSNTNTTNAPKTPSTGTNQNEEEIQSEEPISASTIINAYTPAFAALEEQADVKLSALIQRAKTEYTQKQQAGEKINYAYFYSKYSGAAEELEGSTDAVFYSLLDAFKQELQVHGFATSYATGFISEYEAKKAKRRNSIMSHVK